MFNTIKQNLNSVMIFVQITFCYTNRQSNLLATIKSLFKARSGSSQLLI